MLVIRIGGLLIGVRRPHAWLRKTWRCEDCGKVTRTLPAVACRRCGSPSQRRLEARS